MSEFDGIIRPFVGDSVSPPQQYFQQGQVGVPPVILRFGRGGGGKIINGSINSTETFYMTQYYAEKANAAWGTSV